MGTTQSGGGIFRRNVRFSDFAGFAQDDFKLTRRLTVNAGIRYEIFGAPTETGGKLANFDANIAAQGPVPATGTFSGFTVPSNFQAKIPAGVVQNSFASLWKDPVWGRFAAAGFCMADDGKAGSGIARRVWNLF
ncbi:MAG: hypothetical protein WDM87_17710 [Terracidiphilus sp.]